MKYFFLVLVYWVILLLPVSSFSAGDDQKNYISSVHFSGRGGEVESVEFHLDNRNGPKVFELHGDKPRLVLDFEGMYAREDIEQKIRTWGKYIKFIRTGFHKDPVVKTRVVFDLAKGYSYDIVHSFGPSGTVYHVEIKPNEKSAVRDSPQPEKMTADRKKEKADIRPEMRKQPDFKKRSRFQKVKNAL